MCVARARAPTGLAPRWRSSRVSSAIARGNLVPAGDEHESRAAALRAAARPKADAAEGRKLSGRGASVPVRADRGHAGNEARRCASTEGEHAQCHAFRRSREARTEDRGANRERSRGARTHGDESPRPRRVYIALGYVKGEARRRAGRPARAKRTRTRAVPGPINAFIGQRPLAARVTGRGTWGHAWRARCGAPGTNAPRAGARRGRGRVTGRCSSAGGCAISSQDLTAAPARSRRLRERATTEHESRGRGRARAFASVRDAREE